MTRPRPMRWGRSEAFTLVEMVVVVLIIGLVLGISFPLIRATFNANAIDNSRNNVSAQLSTARAFAQRDGRDTALVFFGNGKMRVLQFKRKKLDPSKPFEPILTPVDDRPSYPLGERIKMLGFQIGYKWQAPQTSAPLAVWFGPDGVLRRRLPEGFPKMNYDENGDEYIVGTAEKDITPVPIVSLMLYDVATDFDAEEWIKGTEFPDAETRVLSFNRYTGTLIHEVVEKP